MKIQAVVLFAAAASVASTTPQDCTTLPSTITNAPVCSILTCSSLNQDTPVPNFGATIKKGPTPDDQVPPGCDSTNYFLFPSIDASSMTGGKYTGSFPVGFGSSFEYELQVLDLSNNKITGGLKNLAGNKLANVNLENNQITDSVSNFIQGFPTNCTEYKLAGNQIPGNYNDAALTNFLKTSAPFLSRFTLSMNPGQGCIPIDEINAVREAAGSSNILMFRDDPSLANCDTASPTPPPQTFPPSPPTQSPTFPPVPTQTESTPNPTPSPSISPTASPNRSPPASETGRPTSSEGGSTEESLTPLVAVGVGCGILVVVIGTVVFFKLKKPAHSEASVAVKAEA